MRERCDSHALPATARPSSRTSGWSWSRPLRAVAVALPATLGLLAAPLAPATADVLRFDSRGAVLEAHATVRDGCTTRVVSVSAFTGVERGEYLINYADSRFPSCPGGEFRLTEGQGRGEVRLRGNLSVTHLVGSVPVTDSASGATDTVTIDLTFTGVGPIRRENSVQTRYVDEDMPDVSRVIAVRSKTRSALVTGTPDLGWDGASVHVSRQLEVQRPVKP